MWSFVGLFLSYASACDLFSFDTCSFTPVCSQQRSRRVARASPHSECCPFHTSDSHLFFHPSHSHLPFTPPIHTCLFTPVCHSREADASLAPRLVPNAAHSHLRFTPVLSPLPVTPPIHTSHSHLFVHTCVFTAEKPTRRSRLALFRTLPIHTSNSHLFFHTSHPHLPLTPVCSHLFVHTCLFTAEKPSRRRVARALLRSAFTPPIHTDSSISVRSQKKSHVCSCVCL